MLRSSRFTIRLAASAPRPLLAPPASIGPSAKATCPFPASRIRPTLVSVGHADNQYQQHRPKRFYAANPYEKIDVQAEKKLAKEKLEARPEEVSTESTTRKVFEKTPQPTQTTSGNVRSGLQHDIGIVKETFQMNDVPREPYLLGVAGTLPYLATSLSTVYLSWDLNTQWPSTSTFVNNIHMNHESAQYWLQLLEPVQLGYGAIIISFLGAVHWGMEYNEPKPAVDRAKFRYGTGVLASIVAWPTLFLPIEAALIAQFLAFTSLYYVDSRATTRGWAPAWYARYRFTLTAIVGIAIFVSLVGRAKIGSTAPRIGSGIAESMSEGDATSKVDWAKLEAEEKAKLKKEKEKQAAEAEKKRDQKKGEQGNSTEGSSNKSKEDKEDTDGNKVDEAKDKSG